MNKIGVILRFAQFLRLTIHIAHGILRSINILAFKISIQKLKWTYLCLTNQKRKNVSYKFVI